MSLLDVAVRDQRVGAIDDDVPTDERLLSVAEIQQALRALRARDPVPDALATEPTGNQLSRARGRRLPRTGNDLNEQWVSVVAAHAGAGASTVALAIADAAAALGRATHLVEAADPTRSGLAAAATSELGVDPSGAWRRGTRGHVTIDRRADQQTPTAWPVLPTGPDGLVLVDLGLPTADSICRLAVRGSRIVVVCRPTVPGVRLAEQLVNSFNAAITVASVGSGKWPGEVSASLGPRLRALWADGAVVTVPADRRLEVSGPTNSPLPKPVANAGRLLLGRIDVARAGGPPQTHAAQRKEAGE